MESVYLTSINYSTTVLKGKKRYFIEGYASTIEEDFYNETITLKGQLDLVSQLLGRTVTVDLDHSAYYNEAGQVVTRPQSKIPIGKVVETHLKSMGAWVKIEINQDQPLFNFVWKSIMNKYLHALSVAFNPIKKAIKVVNGVKHTYYDGLRILNLALTGVPVNPGATFNPVLKSMLKKENGDNMTDVEQTQEDIKDTPVDTQEPVEEPKDKPVEKPVETEPETKTEPETEPVEDTKEETTEDTTLKSINELTEVIDKQRQTISEYKKELETTQTELKSLKSDFEKFKEEPVMKSILHKEPKIEEKETEFNAFKYI